MSKWTQKLRRGAARHFGSQSPPGAADWTWLPDGAGVLEATRTIPIPPPATHWTVRYRLGTSGAWTETTPATGTTITLYGLQSGQTYQAQASWWSATARQSEFSDTKTATPF